MRGIGSAGRVFQRIVIYWKPYPIAIPPMVSEVVTSGGWLGNGKGCGEKGGGVGGERGGGGGRAVVH